VPIFTIAAWYDIFLGGSLRNYVGVKVHGGNEAARRGQRLLVMIGGHAGSGRKIGDVDFGPAAEFDEDDATLSWYDYLLKNATNPAPTVGGPLCCDAQHLKPGPRDQRPVEGRADVLAYSTPMLNEDLEVTGPVRLELFASSSAVDTDFTAKLVDVWPDGFAQN